VGLSLRGYAKHRGCRLFSVQKACRSGRIPVLADGSIDPVAADASWNAAAEARRAAGRAPANPTRVMLPAGSLAAAEATVRAVLVEHGTPADKALTISDVRLVNEILRAKERAEAIAAKKVIFRLRQRAVAMEAIDKRLVDAFIVHAVQTICEFVNPRDVPEALGRLRELQARWVPGTMAETDLPPEELPEEPQSEPPTPESCSDSCDPAPAARLIDCLPSDSQPCGEADQTLLHRPPLDETPAGGTGQSTAPVAQAVDALPEPTDQGMAAGPTLQCGTCANMAPSGWCRSRRFTVTPTLSACLFYEPIPPGQRSRA
jgi:hypothetical protein